ncbi:MAG: low molecular weight phosphatase family protein [Archaeoglobi archaeon]|nr:low molecular weight phosphatase family protein [Candidatus Mnemosynella bozhongmuii]
MFRSILFVCVGNLCRSPMAEGIFRRMCEENGVRVRVYSAGTNACNLKVPEEAIRAAKIYGADISGHRPRQLTQEIASQYEAIIAMTRDVANRTEEIVDHEVIMTLGDFARIGDWDIPDPWGKGFDEYVRCARMIHAALEKALQRYYL